MANPSAGSAKAAVATPPAAAAPPLKSARRVTVSPSYAPTQPRSAVYGDFFFLRLEGSAMFFPGGISGSERNYRRHFTVNVSTGVTNPCAQAGSWASAPGWRAPAGGGGAGGGGGGGRGAAPGGGGGGGGPGRGAAAGGAPPGPGAPPRGGRGLRGRPPARARPAWPPRAARSPPGGSPPRPGRRARSDPPAPRRPPGRLSARAARGRARTWRLRPAAAGQAPSQRRTRAAPG